MSDSSGVEKSSYTGLTEPGLTMTESTVNLPDMPGSLDISGVSLSSSPGPVKRPLQASPRKTSKGRDRTLSEIDRYTLCSNRIV